MDIRYKLYPYPVLSSYADDYENSCFDAKISPKRDGHGIRFDFFAKLVNEELNELLEKGKACFVYHLECAQTGYRTVVATGNAETTHFVSDKSVRGRLQICPFIIATEDLPAYVNRGFHSDYRGFKFSIEAGCVMAVGSQVNIDIDNEINDLSNTPSVFSIIKNDDKAAQGMVVDMEYRKIVIKLPEEEFYNFKSIRDEIVIKPVLNSLVVIPALTYVLEEVAKRDTGERYEYSSYSWYRAIKKALATKFNCDIESEQLSEKNILELSQKLIDTPITDALRVLSDGYGNISEEDDE
ncbi:MAG: hypothetical protein FWH32_03260 [Clostridiales bacterium]|nr:hypothetical protein [Clostridiales bacterium]